MWGEPRVVFSSLLNSQYRGRMPMSLYKLPVVLDPQPEGGYTITCPLLPELITEADTLDEVVPNVADALATVIEIYEDMGRPLPDVLRPVTDDFPLLVETLIPVTAR
jgi:antitoxin HicB